MANDSFVRNVNPDKTDKTRSAGREQGEEAAVRVVDMQLALHGTLRGLAILEGELRSSVIQCCDGRDEFCESFGCSNITYIAEKLRELRYAALELEGRAERRLEEPSTATENEEGHAGG